jgi:hypothetical protein
VKRVRKKTLNPKPYTFHMPSSKPLSYEPTICNRVGCDDNGYVLKRVKVKEKQSLLSLDLRWRILAILCKCN